MTTHSRSRVAWIAAPLFALALTGSVAADAADAAAPAPDATVAPKAPAAADTAQNGPASSNKDDLQTVVVYGMTANLEKSLELKKLAPVVMDSINSTELGRFPDADVADSLAHLPGITIERTTGGEGQKITVRGLTSQYNIVTLNNRILASDDDGRDLAFDVLPAELITGADVLKSPQASAVEGSIGGTVNLRTASAFGNPGFHAGAHAEGNYNDMSKLWGSRYSLFITNTNEPQTLGFVLGGVYSAANTRTDSLNAYNQNIYGPTIYPFTASPGAPGSVPLTATPCCITFGSIFDDKKRSALSGSLEWRPDSTFRLTADALWTHLNDPQIGYNQSYYFAAPDDTGFYSDGVTPWATNVAVRNGVINSLSVNQFQPEMVNNTTNRKVDTYLYGLNASWKPLERLGFTLDVYRSTASRPEGGADTFVTAGLVNDQPVAVDILNFTNLPHSLPNINVVVPPGQLGLTACPSGAASTTNAGMCSYTALMNSGYLNDNKYWSTHYVVLNGYSVHDAITGVTLDGAWEVNKGIFDRLMFGLGYTDRKKTRDDSSNDWTNGSGQYGTLYQTAGGLVQPYPYSFASQGFNVISMVNIPHFMQGAGGSYPKILPRLDASQLFAFLKSLNGKPNPQFCLNTRCTEPSDFAPFDFSLTVPQVNPYNSYDVTEKTANFYVEQTFASGDWSGNIGVRVVRTKTTAGTASAVPTALWAAQASLNSSTPTWTVIYGTSQSVGASGDYTLALPSLNLAYWVLPQTLQARLSIARTMARPNLSELAPTSSNNAINGTPELFYNGTAGLQPIKANQGDLSIEWYYGPHSALTAAVFYKKLKDDIYSAVQTNVDLGTLQYTGGPPARYRGYPSPGRSPPRPTGWRALFPGSSSPGSTSWRTA